MRIFMPGGDHETMRALSDAQVQQFIEDGFIRIDRAFPRELADAGRAILWRDTGCDPDDPTTWRKPVIRLGHYEQAPFRTAVQSCTRRSTVSLVRDDGRRATALAAFQCDFRARTIRVTQAGMSMSAFPASPAIRTSEKTSPPGGSMCPPAAVRC